MSEQKPARTVSAADATVQMATEAALLLPDGDRFMQAVALSAAGAARAMVSLAKSVETLADTAGRALRLWQEEVARRCASVAARSIASAAEAKRDGYALAAPDGSPPSPGGCDR